MENRGNEDRGNEDRGNEDRGNEDRGRMLTWFSPGRRGMEAALPWPSIGGKRSVSE